MCLPPALKPHILVVDDDDRLRELLRLFLTENGFIVSTASGGIEARGKLASLAYDLMVLDIMMPGESGLELALWIRKEPQADFRMMPILFLTARAEAQERIEGLETGADDYMTKPFEPRELLLRINAILRRIPKPAVIETMPELKLGKWHYIPSRDELRSGDESLRLTDMEASLMRVLAAEPGVVVSREVLGERTGKGATINDRTIDVQVTRLRRKIEGDTKNPRYLVTVRGEGYMLMPDMD
jgi:two-component system phosphate regulon response regulator OmpR